uniref:Uncharacterized protein n=1 Tax=Proboscia inermis TaxID=420281 RepID=A0A7S0BWL3_9STRA|mmetsp:Transcript_11711/g.11767  ORF Transcript_11711/g.11767 Transcript_11711/m.11767 type:complete len:207 (+) Transcript_11711:1-621(+)
MVVMFMPFLLRTISLISLLALLFLLCLVYFFIFTMYHLLPFRNHTQIKQYKPLSQPAVCNKCHKRTIKAAYHTICSKCAITTTKKDLPTPACIEVSDSSTKQEVITTRMCAMCTTEPVTNQNDDEKAELNMEGLKLRERKTLERQRAREEQRQKNAENDENEIKNESEIEDDDNDDESTKISCDDCEEIIDNEGESAVNLEIPKIQ